MSHPVESYREIYERVMRALGNPLPEEGEK